ncbi:MAG: trigger factor [Xanthobacteraceae bacterium]
MEITETVTDGLKREFQVQVPATDLRERLDQRLVELKDRVQLRGFRPGKVPVSHLRKLYGKQVMAETVDALIRELNAKIVSERGLRLAMEPKVTIPNEEAAVPKIIGGEIDLAYTLALEVLPKVELADFKGITLERLVADVTDEQVDAALARIAEQNRPYSSKGEGAKVENGDRAVIDFTGTIEGKPFEGGTGGDVNVEVGSGTFVPGMEDQLIGMSVGEQRRIKVTFPAQYPNTHLAGKEVEFDVTLKAVEVPGTVTLDDAFAKSLGLDSLDKLKEAVKAQLQQEHAGLSRQRVKRQLLDKLDEMHKFALPPTMAEQEFKNVWDAVDGELKGQGRSFADEGTTEEKAREEYRGIAERRVRLGLVLAEIGEKNNITVSEDEIKRAILERARQIPGREQQVWEYYSKNSEAVAGIRAPIFEEKVVDFLLELAKVTERKVTRKELEEEAAAGERPTV